MDPRTYCQQGRAALLGKRGHQQQGRKTSQVLAVLAYFAQQELTERDFVAQLVLLRDSAERSGRAGLAVAARAVLRDGETQEPGRATAQPGAPKRAQARR